ncbi:Uu.00g101130.m01.CDS01 [Anthostomella pinea]|uniref:Uu.00g101130.m01.CDS01 n=1 Tax=Anthostomella pinea TaxID=933095 RepID=A0AAI8V812_9PEZI|nr:Uu.00g101130.m01.CDS01 [Anthostomella pinea]
MATITNPVDRPFHMMKLPPELRQAIVDECDSETLGQLMSTCRAMYDASAPRARASIHIMAGKDKIYKLFEKCLRYPLMMGYVKKLGIIIPQDHGGFAGLRLHDEPGDYRFGLVEFISEMHRLQQIYISIADTEAYEDICKELEQGLCHPNASVVAVYPELISGCAPEFARRMFIGRQFPNLQATSFDYSIAKQLGTWSDLWDDQEEPNDISHLKLYEEELPASRVSMSELEALFCFFPNLEILILTGTLRLQLDSCQIGPLARALNPLKNLTRLAIPCYYPWQWEDDMSEEPHYSQRLQAARECLEASPCVEELCIIGPRKHLTFYYPHRDADRPERISDIDVVHSDMEETGDKWPCQILELD